MVEGAAPPAPFGNITVPQPKSSAPSLPHFPRGENEPVEYTWVSISPFHPQILGEIMKIRNSHNPICAKETSDLRHSLFGRNDAALQPSSQGWILLSWALSFRSEVKIAGRSNEEKKSLKTVHSSS